MIMPWKMTYSVIGVSIPMATAPLRVTFSPGNAATVTGFAREEAEGKFVLL